MGNPCAYRLSFPTVLTMIDVIIWLTMIGSFNQSSSLIHYNGSQSYEVHYHRLQTSLSKALPVSHSIAYRYKSIWVFVTCYGSIGGYKSTKSLSGKRLNWLVRSRAKTIDKNRSNVFLYNSFIPYNLVHCITRTEEPSIFKPLTWSWLFWSISFCGSCPAYSNISLAQNKISPSSPVFTCPALSFSPYYQEWFYS
jgi:hypothetical protein